MIKKTSSKIIFVCSIAFCVALTALIAFFEFSKMDNEQEIDNQQQQTQNPTQITEQMPEEPEQPDANETEAQVAEDEIQNEQPQEQQTQETEETQETEPVDAEEPGDWKLMLVNPWNSIPEGYVDTIELQDIGGGHSMDKRAYPDFVEMVEAARAEGLAPYVGSSFRPHSLQQTYFRSQTNMYINMGYSEEDAKKEAGKSVAVPGTSEHELGLALDITATDYKTLDEAQENTAEQKWLMQNSWKYGFILRYPSDKCEITGIVYEPWHYRYVGKEAAKEIFEKGICFEEYLQQK